MPNSITGRTYKIQVTPVGSKGFTFVRGKNRKMPLAVVNFETPLCRPVSARFAVFDLDLKSQSPSFQARP